MTDLAKLKIANSDRWLKVHLTRGPEFIPVAQRLVAAKARYLPIEEATGVPWFIVAVIHEREASQNFNSQLGQGDPLGQISTHVPTGRGPFFNHPNDPPGQDAFYRAALDALIDCPPFAAKWNDWSAGGSMTLLERYNGLAYANAGVASPYVWSGTDQYTAGKVMRDHGPIEPVVDKQLGCAGLILAMMRIDPTITFTGAKIISRDQPKPLPVPPEIKLPPPGQVRPNVAPTFWGRFTELFKPKV